MTTETQSLLEFPCRFPVKAMGRNGGGFQALVVEIVSRHARLYPGEEVRAAVSGAGNFVSVTVMVEALSRNQLDRIYHDLCACGQVLMAL